MRGTYMERIKKLSENYQILFYTKGCSFHENIEIRIFTTAKTS